MTSPIILVHGIVGFGQLTVGGTQVASYFRAIPQALRQRGWLVPDPPQLYPATIAERANELKRYLDKLQAAGTVNGPVHIIAHSMGGLDTRFMISQLAVADRVASLTTIGTPHRGSLIADLVVQGTEPRVMRMIEQLGVGGISDLTSAACEQFNRDCPESPGVHYYSVAGSFEPPRAMALPLGILGLSHDLIHARQGENDGLVSIQSAQYGAQSDRWIVLGTWTANHFRLVNWGTDIVPTPAELLDNSIVDKYCSIADRILRDQQ